METVWDTFWKNKGQKMEWSQKDIFESKNLNNILSKMLIHLNKKDLKGATLVELGSGIGITSLYFATKGAKVTLLDKSKEVVSPAKEYWKGYAIPSFIFSDISDFKPKNKYDIVTSFGLCEHFIGKERKDVLKKHVDLLKPKGVAVISVPCHNGVFYRLGKFIAEKLGIWSFGLEIPFKKKELIDFAKENNLSYELLYGGFYSSIYDLFIRKPLKVLKIDIKRRFDNTTSFFDKYLGSSLVIILKK